MPRQEKEWILPLEYCHDHSKDITIHFTPPMPEGGWVSRSLNLLLFISGLVPGGKGVEEGLVTSNGLVVIISLLFIHG